MIVLNNQNDQNPPPLSTISTKMETLGEEDNIRNNINVLTRSAWFHANNQMKNLSFSLSLDGSKDTENGFQMLLQEYLPHRNKLNCVFIYDNENDQEFTYQNQKDTIISKFETLLYIKFPNKDRYTFYTNQLYPERFNAEIEQVYSYIIKNCSNVDYMVFGYGGLKNQICNYVFQYNAIDYLLCNSIKPFILIKEFCLRKTSLNKNYHWLFIIENHIPEGLKAIEAFKDLINFSCDQITIGNLIPENGRDYLKDLAISKVIRHGIEFNRVEYNLIEYSKKPGQKIKEFSEFVNFNNNHSFSFIIFYNKPQKYLLSRMDSDIFKMIVKCAGNVCVMNNFK